MKLIPKNCTFFFIVSMMLNISNAQSTFNQVGANINGETSYSYSGEAVAISGDATTIAIGARYNDGSGTERGHTRIYKNIAGTWTQLGADLDGEADYDHSGYSVAINENGTVVAIGAPYNSSATGQVRVFKYISGAWVQLGSDIDGENTSDRSGSSIAISANGLRIIIGATENSGNGNYKGHARVYEFDNGSSNWSQLGADIDGENDYDFFGRAVSMSDDGYTVAIGSTSNDGGTSGGYYRGHVKIYKLISGTWTQQGSDIDGGADYDQIGYSISLSEDGTVVAIGAPYMYVGSNPQQGKALIYKFISGSWSQLGSDINGDASYDEFGYSLSLSNDGNWLAAAAPVNAGGGTERGKTKLFQYKSGTWTQQGPDIEGESDYDFSGRSVSISSNGKIIGIGAPENDDNGSASGHVRVFEFEINLTIVVKGGDKIINLGDNTPSDLDSTDFGTVISSASSSNTYTIVNISTDTLFISSIVTSGAYSADFTVSNIPNFILAGDSSTFNIAFSPISTQLRTATITINSNNAYTPNYDFTIQGYYINTSTCGLNQVGGDIDGESGFDYSGFSTASSSDGKTIAIGAIYNPGGGSNRGHVRVYKNISGTWTQLGADIDGEADDDYSGTSVSMNADGTIVAIGAIYNDGTGTDRGHVRIYEFDGTNWVKLGADIDGIDDGDEFGKSVSLSSSGSRVAIGAKNNSNNFYTNNGQVRIFEFNTGTSSWQQVGAAIGGESSFDNSGYSIAMNGNGNVIAIGANANDGGSSYAGHVRVYEFDISSSAWTQLGVDIDGENSNDRSGWSVSINNAGDVVAIGAPYNAGGGFSKGHVRIFRLISGTWTQWGSDIDGENSGDESGWSVALNNNGDAVIIGAKTNTGGGTQNGHARMYRNIGGNWTQIGSDLDGENNYDYFGSSVSLSDDGSTAVVGAYLNGSGRGHVRVFEIGCPEPEIEVFGNKVAILNGATNASFMDSTDFGNVYAGAGRYYKIKNTGADNLLISSINIAGSHATDFTVSNVPSSIAVGDSAIFKITFNSSNVGTKNAVVTILNNDADEYEFDFAVSATLMPEAKIVVMGNNMLIVNGDSTPSNLDSTDFGFLTSNISRNFKIKNLGADTLKIDSIYFSGPNATHFVVGSYPAYLLKGDSGVLSVYPKNSSFGLLKATININNSDIDDSNFQFAIQIIKIQCTPAQLGADIDGASDYSYSGYAVAMSADGKSLAIGDKFSSIGGSNKGLVRVYKINNGVWIQQGSNIFGTNNSDNFGYSVSLSADGSILAVGAIGFGGQCTGQGLVRAYQFINSNWKQIGQDMIGEGENFNFGYSVSLSSNGKTLAVGEPLSNANGSKSGRVSILQFINNSWNKIGKDIIGESYDNFCGIAVSLSSDGGTVAISAPGNNAAGTKRGHARVFKNINENWSQLGSDIDGTVNNDQFGHSISLSADGKTMAMGSIFSAGGGSNRGQVRVFELISSVWVQKGSILNGTLNNEIFGRSISLNSDGNILAVGASSNSGGGAERGQVRIFKYFDSEWKLASTPINGETDFDVSGWSVSINSNGTRIAIGAVGNEGSGAAQGHMRVFELDCIQPNIKLKSNNQNIENGDLTTKINNHTDFGSINLVDTKSSIFKILNRNNDTLKIDSILCVGYKSSDFIISNIPTFVKPLDSASFTVTFDPSGSGDRYASIQIISSELIENNYDFQIKGHAISNSSAVYTTQCGPPIFGVQYFNAFGWNYSFNHDGTILAAGAIGYGGGSGTTGGGGTGGIGQVRIFKKDSNDNYVQFGNSLNGSQNSAMFGWSTALSADGLTLAIGSPYASGGGILRGFVNVYRYSSGTWSQIGSSLQGKSDSSCYGWAVSLSADGTVLSIGGHGYGLLKGSAAVYKYNSGAWTQLGADIDGISRRDEFGRSVSLNDDGSILVVGSDKTSGGGISRGQVKIFKYNGSSWNQIGNSINGKTDNNFFGWSVSINSDGNIIAVGNRNSVFIYENIAGTWSQKGSDLNNVGGYTVSLSGDGQLLTTGDIYGGGYGIVNVFRFVCGNWVQQINTIQGEKSEDLAGIGYMSKDGSTLGVGSFGKAGCIDKAGQIQVYKLNYPQCRLNSTIPNSTGIYTSCFSNTDSSFTCYCDSSGKLLLALDLTGSGAVIPSNGVKLKIGSPSIIAWSDTGGIITHDDGAAIFNRKWDVNATAQPNSPVKVKYFFTQLEYDSVRLTLAALGNNTISSPSNLEMYKLSNNGFNDPHAAGAVGIIYTNGTAPSLSEWSYSSIGSNHCAEFLVSSFSGGGGGAALIPAIPLPLKFISFSVKGITQTSALLKWQMASEVNTNYFNVERSLDGVNFIKIGIVKATISNAGNYQYIDNTISIGTQKAFYRINQVDINGKNANTNIQLVNFGKINSNVLIYPNPMNTELNMELSLEQGEKANISIADIQGKIVFYRSVSTTKSTLDLSTLSNGVYTISIQKNGVVENFKIVKQ